MTGFEHGVLVAVLVLLAVVVIVAVVHYVGHVSLGGKLDAGLAALTAKADALLHTQPKLVVTASPPVPGGAPKTAAPLAPIPAAPAPVAGQNRNVYAPDGSISGTDRDPASGLLWTPGYRPGTHTWDPMAAEQGVPPTDPKYVRPRQLLPTEQDGTFGNTSYEVGKPGDPNYKPPVAPASP